MSGAPEGVAGNSGLSLPEGLPKSVQVGLEDFCAAARSALGDDLRSLVLFGSAVEARMGATSDVNLLLVLRSFEPVRVNAIRESLRIAAAAIRLQTMFIVEDELQLAAESFAVKFEDILYRRHVIYGSDPFAGLTIPPEMIKHRLYAPSRKRPAESGAVASLRRHTVKELRFCDCRFWQLHYRRNWSGPKCASEILRCKSG